MWNVDVHMDQYQKQAATVRRVTKKRYYQCQKDFYSHFPKIANFS